MAGNHENPQAGRMQTEDRLDRELLERVGDRDRAALATLYNRYHGTLLRFLHRLTGDLETAQEAINDVMLAVWNGASGFKGRSKVSTWIFGIAYRKGMKLRARLSSWVVRFKAGDWDTVIERFGDAGEHTNTLIEQDLMYRAMEHLPPKQRAVVELTYVLGYSYEEIAEIVGCPANTVKTRMFHARARLRELVPKLGRDEDG